MTSPSDVEGVDAQRMLEENQRQMEEMEKSWRQRLDEAKKELEKKQEEIRKKEDDDANTLCKYVCQWKNHVLVGSHLFNFARMTFLGSAPKEADAEKGKISPSFFDFLPRIASKQCL